MVQKPGTSILKSMYPKDEYWPSRECKYKPAGKTGTGGSEFGVDLRVFPNHENIEKIHWLQGIEGVGRFTECNLPYDSHGCFLWLSKPLSIRCFLDGLPDHPSPTFFKWSTLECRLKPTERMCRRELVGRRWSSNCQLGQYCKHLFTYFDLINALV